MAAPRGRAPQAVRFGATVIAGRGLPSGVTVIDISCPDCGATDAVAKVRIGRYRCAACGHGFDHADLDPAAQSGD